MIAIRKLTEADRNEYISRIDRSYPDIKPDQCLKDFRNLYAQRVGLQNAPPPSAPQPPQDPPVVGTSAEDDLLFNQDLVNDSDGDEHDQEGDGILGPTVDSKVQKAKKAAEHNIKHPLFLRPYSPELHGAIPFTGAGKRMLQATTYGIFLANPWDKDTPLAVVKLMSYARDDHALGKVLNTSLNGGTAWDLEIQPFGLEAGHTVWSSPDTEFPIEDLSWQRFLVNVPANKPDAMGKTTQASRNIPVTNRVKWSEWKDSCLFWNVALSLHPDHTINKTAPGSVRAVFKIPAALRAALLLHPKWPLVKLHAEWCKAVYKTELDKKDISIECKINACSHIDKTTGLPPHPWRKEEDGDKDLIPTVDFYGKQKDKKERKKKKNLKKNTNTSPLATRKKQRTDNYASDPSARGTCHVSV
jgi:hypothetical protein